MNRDIFDDVFDKMWKLTVTANEQFFGFHIDRLRYMQLTEYDEVYKGEYKRHHDVFWLDNPEKQRKLSVVLQLTDKDTYSGGDLGLEVQGESLTDHKDIGTVIWFPSWTPHWVTPVTKGRRNSIVCWFEGTSLEMKTFVITLGSRQDRLIAFDNANWQKVKFEEFAAIDGSKLTYSSLIADGFDTNKNWIDPINKTHISQGEVGCFLSHYLLWKKCIDLNEPILILEDDAIITNEFDIEKIEKLTDEYNFIYLGWLEMAESKPINDELVVPEYPYWTLAYVVTPESASKLLEGNIRKNIIPVDEYLPLRMKDLNPCGFKENVVTPVGRDVFPSDVDPTDRYKYFLDFKTYALTVGSDDEQCWRLYATAKDYNLKVRNVGNNVTWKGSDMSGPGGGQKINILRSYLDKLTDHDVVLFMDGYDTFTVSNLEEITRRYLEFKCKVLFAAEQFL